MRNLKKLLAVLVVVVMIATTMIPAFAAESTSFNFSAQAQTLKDLGLYLGTSTTTFTPALGDSVDRQTGVVLLLRLLGKDATALAMTDADADSALAAATDLKDVKPYFKKYIAYAVANKIYLGTSTIALTLSPIAPLTGDQYAALLLRNLGYTQDASGAAAVLAEKAGISADLAKLLATKSLIRDDLVGMSFGALSAKDSNGATVIENLIASGAVKVDAAVAAKVYALPAAAVATTVTVAPITVAEMGTATPVVTVKDQYGATMTSGYTLSYELTPATYATVSTTGTVTAKAYAVANASTLKVTATPTVGTAVYGTGTVTVSSMNLAVTGATASNLAEIVVNFNKEVDSTKVIAANFTVGGANAASVTLSDDKKSVTVVPGTISATNKADYALVVKAAVGIATDYSATVRAFDTTIPTVTSVTLTGPNTFDILFSEPIKTAGTVKVNNGIYGVTIGAVGTNKVTATLSASSLTDGNYTINLAGFLDYAGFSMDATDKTLAYVKDTKAPVATITGTPGQTQVVVTFDKAVTLDNTNGRVDYFYQTFSAWAPDTVTTTDNKSYTLTFTKYPIPAGTANIVVKYKSAVANSDIVDAWGNKATANTVLPVTVSADTTAPTVTAVTVTDEKTVVVKFSESLNLAAATAVAQTATNYVVKDSTGTAVTTGFSAIYDEIPANNLYEVTLKFNSKLAGGNYTVDVKNIIDSSLAANTIAPVTKAFAITDLTPIDFATASDVVVTAIESTTANTPDVIYVTFAEKMATSGQYSVLDANNYLFNGAALPTGTTLTPFGSTGKVVKITIPENATFDAQKVVTGTLTIARVADLAGNKTVALSGSRSIAAEGVPTVTAVKLTDSNKATVTINKPLSVVLASGFTAGTGLSLHEVAAIDSWSVDSNNNTIVNVTLNAANAASTTDTSDTITHFDIVPNILVAETGAKMGIQDCAPLITENRAPKLIASSPIVAGIANTIVVKFTEALDATGSMPGLYANDLVVTKADGTVLVPGLDYTTALANSNHDIVITLTAPLAADTAFKVASKATINYIRDAVATINTKAIPFATNVDVTVLH